jgi:Transcription termination factor nusG
LRRTVRHARKLRDTLKPLFPSYIFVAIDLSKHRWRSINETFGTASLIIGAEQPTSVPPGVVEALVASCKNCRVVRLDEGLEIDQKVCMLSGRFAEALCRLEHRMTAGVFACYSKSWVWKLRPNLTVPRSTRQLRARRDLAESGFPNRGRFD